MLPHRSSLPFYRLVLDCSNRIFRAWPRGVSVGSNFPRLQAGQGRDIRPMATSSMIGKVNGKKRSRGKGKAAEVKDHRNPGAGQDAAQQVRRFWDWSYVPALFPIANSFASYQQRTSFRCEVTKLFVVRSWP